VAIAGSPTGGSATVINRQCEELVELEKENKLLNLMLYGTNHLSQKLEANADETDNLNLQLNDVNYPLEPLTSNDNGKVNLNLQLNGINC
jgi:hypothetical protein